MFDEDEGIISKLITMILLIPMLLLCVCVGIFTVNFIIGFIGSLLDVNIEVSNWITIPISMYVAIVLFFNGED